jgi:hypothetical protein
MNWFRIKLVLISLITLIINNFTHAQHDSGYISPQMNGNSWEEFIHSTQKQKNIRFFYQKNLIPDKKIHLPDTAMLLTDYLDIFFQNSELHVYQDGKGDIFITTKPLHPDKISKDFFNNGDKKDEAPRVEKDDTFLSTKEEYVPKRIVVGEGQNNKKSVYHMYGFITSSGDGNPLIGVTIQVKGLTKGVVTSDDGYYSLSLPAGDFTLLISSIETKEKKVYIDVSGDGRLDIELEKRIISLEEVTIRSNKYNRVHNAHMGLERLTAQDIDQIPQVLGEKDIVKTAFMLPGVQNTGEGSAGLNVRGSPSDQTLFLINGVPVYNTSHLLGFFTAFNSEAINEFKLYKSNIPLEHGGRLSSVFDISTIQGDRKKFHARGGISPVTGKLLFEGPLKKDKCSAFIGLRSTYSDKLLELVKSPDIRQSNFYFGDIISSVSYGINKKNNIRLFGYYSTDDIGFSTIAKYYYKNTGSSLEWQRIMTTNSKLKVSAVYSNYFFEEQNHELTIDAYKHDFDIRDYKIKAIVDITPNEKHKITAGLKTTLHQLHNGNHVPLNSESLVQNIHLGYEKGIESSIFISDEWKPTENLTLYGGFRYNLYSYLGPEKIFQYPENLPKEVEYISDTSSYGNEIIKNYQSPDIRFSANWIFMPGASVKVSYNQLKQYLFMMSNTISISPTTKWKLSDYHTPPLDGHQLSVGFYSNRFSNALELTIEGYYKWVNNLVEYKNGADLLVNKIPETDIVQGELNAYGIEIMLRKKHGKLNGWLNYTYSNARVEVDSPFPGSRINFGRPYPANYDKPNTFNFVGNYRFSRRLSISGNIVYSTGRPITYPTDIYYQNGKKIISYSNRNEYRLPDYFRIDFSVNLEGNLKKNKRAHSSWQLSVYNLTGRKNAYSVFFSKEHEQIIGYKMSIFGMPIVTLSYNFKLGNYAD